MEALPTVLLRPGEADRPLAGHPWIYHGSLLRTAADIADGALVQVKDHRQRLIGVGFWNSKSKIRVRLLSRERIQIGPEFFRQRIREAHALRQKHLPHHLEMIRLAREKVFGAVKLIEASFGFRIGDPKQWRLRHDLAGGGALMDVGIYALQGTRYVSGEEPTEVFAIETKTDKVKFKEVDESILWSMRFPSGLVANCATTYLVNGMNRLFAAAENGWFQLDPAYSYGGLKGRTSKAEMDFPQVDHFAAEMDDFANCIINNKPSRVPGEEGLRDVKIMTAIYDSIRSGRPVKLR